MNTTESEHGLITEDDILDLPTPLPFIVTGSLLEQVLTAAVVTVFWLYVNTVNGFLIYVIKKTNTLYENVHYTLLSIYMLCDIIFGNAVCFQILPATISNNVLVFYIYYCQIVSAIGKIIYLASVYILGYLAIERLVFFRYPFKYNMYFTKTKIKITSIILISLPIFDVIFVRVSLTTRMYCILPENYKKNPT